jgi:hypothetical protein
MGNPYAQVALTYVRRVQSWGRKGLLIAGAILLLLGILGSWVIYIALRLRPDTQSALACFGGILRGAPGVLLGDDFRVMTTAPWLICLFVFITGHVKEQLGDSRAHLMPGFRRAHVTVLVVVVFIFAVLLPAALAWPAGWRRVGFVGLTLSIFSLILWAVLLQRLVSAYFLFIACMGILDNAPWAKQTLAQSIAGQCNAGAIGLLVSGVVVIGLGIIRLTRLREGMVGYGPPFGIVGWDSGRVRGQVQTYKLKILRLLEERWDEERTMERLARHARCASTSRWSRVCRWQTGMVAGRSAWFWNVLAILCVQFLVWIINQWTNVDPVGLSAATGAVWLVIVPLMPLGQCLQRPLAGRREVLLPVERGAYLKQTGMAILSSQLQLWSAAGVAVVLWWAAAARSSVPVGDVVSALAVSVSLQMCLFGIALWLARYPRATTAIFSILLVLPIAMSLVVAMGVQHRLWLIQWRHPIFFAVAVLFTAVAAALTWGAYRRWLTTDLD